MQIGDGFMGLTIATAGEKANPPKSTGNDRAVALEKHPGPGLTFPPAWIWSMVTRQPTRGSEFSMSGKTPQTRGARKAPQLSMKEKRAQKREKQQEIGFVKPRKSAAR
ncbi:MAG: hypothetical protein PGN24_11660 [Microbacterium arborescens]